MVTDLYAKNQVNICKGLGKKSAKLTLRIDIRTDRVQTYVPFGFDRRGLKLAMVLTHSGEQSRAIFVLLFMPVCPFSGLE